MCQHARARPRPRLFAWDTKSGQVRDCCSPPGQFACTAAFGRAVRAGVGRGGMAGHPLLAPCHNIMPGRCHAPAGCPTRPFPRLRCRLARALFMITAGSRHASANFPCTSAACAAGHGGRRRGAGAAQPVVPACHARVCGAAGRVSGAPGPRATAGDRCRWLQHA